MTTDLVRETEFGPNAGTSTSTSTSTSTGRPIRTFLRQLRMRMDKHPLIRFGYRLLIGILGGGVILFGLVLVPLPGPGWLIVFVGLGILGTEFPAAHKITEAVKRLLVRFWSWVQRRRARKVQRREAQQRNKPQRATRQDPRQDRAPVLESVARQGF